MAFFELEYRTRGSRKADVSTSLDYSTHAKLIFLVKQLDVSRAELIRVCVEAYLPKLAEKRGIELPLLPGNLSKGQHDTLLVCW